MKKKTIIIGIGSVGLTKVYKQATKTAIKPLILEKSSHIDNISKTIIYKRNKLDIGEHRFLFKSKIIINWWHNIMPIQSLYFKDYIYFSKHIPNYNNHKSLKDSFINRFNTELYKTFKKNETKRVWSMPCAEKKNRLGHSKDELRNIKKRSLTLLSYTK